MKREVLNAYEAHKFISKIVKVPETQLVRKFSEITIKAPLVLKIVSEQAVHKTEINGVKIVNHSTEISQAFDELLSITKNNKIKLEGILVQEFVEGQQLIIGLKKDIIFGQVILIGMGGIFAELLNDVAIRKCPINKDEAQGMLDELQASKLFHNFRNINLNADVLKESMVSISNFAQKHKEIVEMDINPFILNSKDGFAVDARIVIEK